MNGAFTAAAFNVAGDLANTHGLTEADFGGANHLAGIAAHAVVGCASSAAAGGSCKSGAAGAAFSMLATPAMADMNGLAGAFAAAVVGGAGSRVGGGSFANGALTGAFGYLFNEVAKRASRAEVLIFEPAGWGGSSFGHAAIVVDGTAYSFGPDGMAIKPSDEYLKQNSFRTAVGSEIYLSSDQAAGMKSFLTGFNDDYKMLKFSTCVQPVVYALGTIGINVGTPLFPASLGSALLDTGSVSKFNFYPRTITPTKPWYYPTNNAPWAR